MNISNWKAVVALVGTSALVLDLLIVFLIAADIKLVTLFGTPIALMSQTAVFWLIALVGLGLLGAAVVLAMLVILIAEQRRQQASATPAPAATQQTPAAQAPSA